MTKFTVYGRPQPQGSTRAFLPKGSHRPIITSDNKHLRPFRQQVSQTAVIELRGQIMAKETPVIVRVTFYFAKPRSAPRKRTEPCVKPDLDKLARAALDSLTGIAYEDDAQVVQLEARKMYGSPERIEVEVGQAKAEER